MINETFVASDPQSAYAQAVEKYGENVKLVSAKQVVYEDGKLRCEVQIEISEKEFLNKMLGEKQQPGQHSSEEKMLLDEITQLKTQLEQMKTSLQSEIMEDDKVISQVRELLIRKGIAPKWLDVLLNTVVGTPIAEKNTLLVSYILEEIDEVLKVKQEDLSKSKVVMLVGPTGTGKTTTIAKLAARYAYMLDRPYKVALFNLDSYKVGAVEQLAHYADIMQIDYVTVESVEHFQEGLESLDTYDIILVDTAGMSPFDTQKFIKTIEYVNSDINRDLEVVLVLPATVKYEDMEDIYKNFSFLNLDSVIITKFDETKHLGTLLNFMLIYNIPMSYFCMGQEVPNDLQIASKEYLVEHFIGDVDEG